MTKEKSSSSLLVHLLAILFGVSSWVDINGLWVELPVLVQELPESWNLASYIVVTTQLANIGPLLFSVIRKFIHQKVLEVPTIHATLSVGTSACILLTFFWNSTTFIAGNTHSTALLVLAFFLSFVDCTSSVLYLPFMANFKETYVISYLIGEGMSGLLPSLVALAQGVGGNPECRNVTKIVEVHDIENITVNTTEAFHSPPRFSVTVFFVILTIMVVCSWIAFFLLNVLPQAKAERVPYRSGKRPSLASGDSATISSQTSKAKPPTLHLLNVKKQLDTKRYFILLTIQTYICLLHNALLSVQTYSCLPYGNLPYHLAVSLSSMANPLVCFVTMFLTIKSLVSVTSVAVFSSAWSAYVMATAVLSPSPPLVNDTSGAALVVLSWILVIGSMAYVKAAIASILRREGGYNALFWCGVMTQVGSACGAFISFGLVNFTKIFHTYSPCST